MKPPPYPRLPHLVAGRGTRDDLVLGDEERRVLLGGPVLVEEKLDGANVMCWAEDGVVHSSGRAGPGSADRAGQFGALRAWTSAHQQVLTDLLAPGEVLYGEWLLLAHTVRYHDLPDMFIALDIGSGEGLVPFETRRRRLTASGLVTPPRLAHGRFGLHDLDGMAGRSSWSTEPGEGVVVRAARPGPVMMAKLLRPGFSRIDDRGWARGRPRNRLRGSTGPRPSALP